jgi:hypothetical protein
MPGSGRLAAARLAVRAVRVVVAFLTGACQSALPAGGPTISAPECVQGYGLDGYKCFDIDECASGQHSCHENASCGNLLGSFSCTCLDGYEGDGFMCVDIDECASGQHGCHENASCGNLPGSFSCTCLDGYDGDGFT